MRAYVLRGSGGASVEDVPIPEPGAGEVRIRVRACALNHLDVFARRTVSGPGIREHHYPHVSGVDVSGEVDSVGDGVEGFHPGMAVVVYPCLGCGDCEFCRRGEISMCSEYRIFGEQTWGGLAEYAVLPAGNLLRLPENFNFCIAAASPVGFTTSWRLLLSAGELRVGESVLVIGVSGGVATAAVQLARLAGARIYATSSQDWKLEKARELGATAVFNHGSGPIDAWVLEATGGRGVDIVVDSVGAATWRQSIRSLAVGGRLCVCGATSGDNPQISIRELYQSHRRVVGAPMGGRPDFDAAMDLVLAGRLSPVIHATFPLEDVAEAMDLLEAGRQFGKVVIEP